MYMLKLRKIGLFVLLAALAGAGTSCKMMKKKKPQSDVTGWNYNDKNMGSFYVPKPKDVKAAPGLVFVQGGTFTMGANQEDVMGDWNNVPRRMTVPSFFIDRTEIANVHYREYIYWLENVFGGAGMDSIVDEAKPDTLVWRSELSYNEPYVEFYFRHPAFNYYPVVGVSWRQADDFCKWRTDRVNERTLMEKQFLDPKSQVKRTMQGVGQDNFNTKAYLMGEYQATPGKGARSKSNPLKDVQGRPRTYVKMEDGILFGDYRLPTEAEWEYAAYGLIMENPQRKFNKKSRGEEVISNKQIYAWKNEGFDNIRFVRKSNVQGAFLANFKRGAGDYMGVAGGLNDNAPYTSEVSSFAPNGFGLYNMSGNVSEWVYDIYRPMSNLDNDDLNPFRGNVFKQVDMSGGQGNLRDDKGRIKMKVEKDSALRDRRNYQRSYAVNYMDGDSLSNAFYSYGITTLVSDKSRVYKGGSWNDMAYWMSPGTRRFLEEDQSSSTLGFRCAMSHVGGSEGLSSKNRGGYDFPKRNQKR